MRKRLFVASSVEGLDVAYAVQENLEHDLEITVWSQGVFEPSRSTLNSLFQALPQFDAAVFVFSPDDTRLQRGRQKPAVRDNVIFELGLFAASLGIESCFILTPRSFSELHLPTDLLGVTPITYDDARDDENLLAALGPACNKIRRKLVPRESPRSRKGRTLQEVLLSRPFRLVFNPKTQRSKRMVFAADGRIVEGNNRNEHSWRIVNEQLELLQLDGKIHSRFRYEVATETFRHTNDPDTLSIRDQVLVPEDSG